MSLVSVTHLYLNCCTVSLCLLFCNLYQHFLQVIIFTFYKLHAKVLINTGDPFVAFTTWHFDFLKCQRTLVPTCNLFISDCSQGILPELYAAIIWFLHCKTVMERLQRADRLTLSWNIACIFSRNYMQ